MATKNESIKLHNNKIMTNALKFLRVNTNI